MKTTLFDFSSYVVHAGYVGGEPVFSCGDGSVHRGLEDERLEVHGSVLAARVTADGNRLVTSGDDGRVMALEAEGEPRPIAEWGRKWIDLLAVGPDGSIAYGAGRQAKVLTAAGKTFEIEEPRAIGGLAFFPKGLRLAVATYNGIRLHYPGTEAEPQFMEWKGAHLSVSVPSNGRFVVTTMQEPALHGWRMPDGAHMRMTGYPLKVQSISWSAKDRYLATSGANVAVVWPFYSKDGPMGQAPLELGAREEIVSAVACHPTEEIVAIGYEDGMVLIARLSDAEEVLMRRPPEDPAKRSPISALAWDRAGQRLSFGTQNGQAGVIDLAAEG